MTIIYRFRPMKYLIGDDGDNDYRELEKQELALSSPRYFNDPLEGYQDVFWEGDEVLWENLLRHYLLNLHQAAITCVLSDDEETLEEYAIEPKLTRGDLSTDERRQQFDSICQLFFEEKGFESVPSSLASLPEPLKRNNLKQILSVIHRSALESVLERMRGSGAIPEGWPEVTISGDSETVEDLLDAISAAMAGENEELLESVASLVRPLESHMYLQQAVQTGVEQIELQHKKCHFLHHSFPDRYIREITNSLIHTNWHTLCFAKECASPPMWATYADEHRGAALMFRADCQTDESWGKMDVSEGAGSEDSEPTSGEITAPLHAVDYESPPPEVDFFRFLGRLPLPKLESAWHSTPDGRTSQMMDEIVDDLDAWRENLWNHFHSMSTRKLRKWEHEQEIRMVLPDLLESEGSHRKVTYDMSQLEGIVFGLRTSLEDRFEVMKIISENNQDGDSSPVEFYEMVYDGKDFRKVKLNVA
ncbi:hypothetical protein D8Y22_20125 [Salinadaptatus halalkaliphilus]|uniref:DUF2971 domain-containing protein n=1 Tax=Salinadaptatus halalkaliphilus TaxID=2419781 RepID=A0A4S3TGQ0_9EURY|nr:hypothetical protein [Salinadaptatus halalkaliphilus]THE63134.1 hypothetical protein D8Y22_20125 [Salinadaptatus halalkaliphilus]